MTNVNYFNRLSRFRSTNLACSSLITGLHTIKQFNKSCEAIVSIMLRSRVKFSAIFLDQTTIREILPFHLYTYSVQNGASGRRRENAK